MIKNICLKIRDWNSLCTLIPSAKRILTITISAVILFEVFYGKARGQAVTVPSSVQDLGKVTVTADLTPIQLGDKVIARANKGEELTVCEIKGEWY